MKKSSFIFICLLFCASTTLVYASGPNFNDTTQKPLVSNADGDLTIDGVLYVDGYIYGDGSQLTGLSASSQWTATGSDIYYTTGNVGIGTITSSEKLEVAGNIKLSSANDKIKQGEFSMYYDGTDQQFELTSGDFIFNGDILADNLSGTNTGDEDLSGYELLSNKSTTITLGNSDTLYPTQKAVKTYVDDGLSNTVDWTNATQNLRTAGKGYFGDKIGVTISGWAGDNRPLNLWSTDALMRVWRINSDNYGAGIELVSSHTSAPNNVKSYWLITAESVGEIMRFWDRKNDVKVLELDGAGEGFVSLPNDNAKLLLGAGKDASIKYDGLNLIINPKEVGSGILDVQGMIQTDGYNSSDGTAGISDSGTSCTITEIKNGLITGATCI